MIEVFCVIAIICGGRIARHPTTLLSDFGIQGMIVWVVSILAVLGGVVGLLWRVFSV